MTTLELAKDFVSMLKKREDEKAGAKYNADSIVSYEAMDGPMAVCKGKEATKQKGEWWRANHEVHGGTVEGPFVNGDQFVVRFTYDVTPKQTGKRMQMDEVGVYKVANGKIVEERFCYLQA
jgi:ketosteroid isomerase-like protein